MCQSDRVNDQLSETTRRAIDAVLAATEPLDRVRAIRSLSAALEAEPALLASVRSALDDGTTWDEIAEKFHLMVDPVLGKDRAQKSIDLCAGLKASSTLGPLMASLQMR